MVWALLVGGVVSSQRRWPMPVRMQNVADAVMGVGILLLVSRIAFTIGPNLEILLEAGPALLLQEIGHLGGTIAIALPVAVALRMGRATVGATFSIDRESSFAIVGDRYGTNSDEYRGVLTMYVFGTLFGALIVTFLASLISSFGIFDPLALAMGAGVGSGSMMAAGAAAIAAAHPEVSDQVLALAATSNLITAILGTYVGVWIALPLADRVYRKLSRTSTKPEPSEPTKSRDDMTIAEPGCVTDDSTPAAAVPLYLSVPFVVGIGIVTASIAAGEFTTRILWGFVIIVALTITATGLEALSRGKIPTIIWASLLGTYLSSPWSPVAGLLNDAVGSIDFLSLCAVVLTFAGLALGKSLPALRAIGWKILPVGLSAILASFVLSTLIAEFTLGRWG
ncbi:DUF3100 domain-containing protein [Rhodococcus jostii]